ncbi:MAG: M64 family metallopeptidase [Bacteroidia bacterium]|nr:M64 family metallopeptidase [Bacteroidia bacterium]
MSFTKQYFTALFLALVCTSCNLSTSTRHNSNTLKFEEKLQNVTLRIDIILRDTLPNREVKVSSISKMGEWTGRRGETYMVDNRPMGNFVYSLIDKETKDTLWVDGFCALYEEWAGTDYEGKRVIDYEHTILTPMPKRDAILVLEQRARNGKYSELLRQDITLDEVKECKSLLAPKVKTLRDSGDPKSTLDILILADGYRAEEESIFDAMADSLAKEWFSREPWSDYKDRVSFRTAFIASDIDRVGDCRKDTLASEQSILNCQFGWHGTDRYLMTNRIFAQTDYVGNTPADFVIMAVNTPIYGGGGIYNEVTTYSASNPLAIELLIHEAGHGFAGLADEYFDNAGDGLGDYYDTTCEPWEPNITSLKHFSDKWEELYKEDKAGLLEGAAYTTKGMYRASDVCLMRVLNEPFCVVCKNAVGRKIKEYLE